MGIEDTRRTVEVSLFTRPSEFGGQSFAGTSITHLLDQGVISVRAVREIEIRCRQLASNTPGLSFLHIKTIGTRKNSVLISFTAQKEIIEVEAPPRV